MTYPIPNEEQQADPNLYAFNSWRNRPKIVWPEGKKLAFWVAPNVEFYELAPPRGPARASWFRPEPDVLHYGIRDYGNRVGFWRMVELFDELGVTASISLNAAVLDHYPEIGRAMADRGWELFSHGVYNTRYQYGMTQDQERELIRDVAVSIHKHSGQKLSGWLSPALANTPETMNMLAEEGVAYTLDLFHDDQPQPVNVRNGELISLPYSLQVNDWTGLHVGSASPRDYGRMIREQFLRLYAEGDTHGTVMCLPLHPWMIGYPHRYEALAEAIEFILGHEGVWHATGREIDAHYTENYYARDHARLNGGRDGR